MIIEMRSNYSFLQRTPAQPAVFLFLVDTCMDEDDMTALKVMCILKESMF